MARVAIMGAVLVAMLSTKGAHGLLVDMFAVGYDTIVVSAELDPIVSQRFRLPPGEVTSHLRGAAEAAIRQSGRPYTFRSEAPADFARGGTVGLQAYPLTRESREFRLRVTVRATAENAASIQLDIAARRDAEIREDKQPAKTLYLDLPCATSDCVRGEISAAFRVYVADLLRRDARVRDLLNKY
jgi:hypothetical protein